MISCALVGAGPAQGFSCDAANGGARSVAACTAAPGAETPAALASPYRVDDAMTVAVRVGSTRVEIDLGRSDPLGGSRVSPTGPVRLFGALDLDGEWKVDSWALGNDGGSLRDGVALGGYDGLRLTQERDDGRLAFGGRIGYLIERLFEPYAKAGLEYNYIRETNVHDDRVGIVFGGGLNIFATESFSANLEGTTTSLRSNLDLYSINARLRFEF